MDRYPHDDHKIKPDTIAAFLVGVVVSYAIQVALRFGGGGILSAIIVVAVGGLWYQWRRIV